MTDPYSVLGIAPGASDKEIKAAFRKLAKKHHPDANGGDKVSEQRFKEINEAYSILSGKQDHKADNGPNFGFDANPFSGFFNENIFNTMFRQGSGRTINRFQVDPILLIQGGQFEYQFQTYENRGGRLFPIRKTASIRVEPDSPAGIQIAVPGTQPNHVILQLIPGSTDRYQVSEMLHLMETQKISVFKAMMGGDHEVTTPMGKKISLKVPAGTQSGSIHRVRMVGLKSPNGTRGDYNIRFEVTIPAIHGEDQEQIKEQLLEKLKEELA